MVRELHRNASNWLLEQRQLSVPVWCFYTKILRIFSLFNTIPKVATVLLVKAHATANAICTESVILIEKFVLFNGFLN
jgi:hypothetical protein